MCEEGPWIGLYIIHKALAGRVKIVTGRSCDRQFVGALEVTSAQLRVALLMNFEDLDLGPTSLIPSLLAETPLDVILGPLILWPSKYLFARSELHQLTFQNEGRMVCGA